VSLKLIEKVGGAFLSQELLKYILQKCLAEFGVPVELNKGLITFEQDEDKLVATLVDYHEGEPGEGSEVATASQKSIFPNQT